MGIDELVRYAWRSGMESYHDTKTMKQLDNELYSFMQGIEDELKSFNAPVVIGSLGFDEGYDKGYSDATKEACREIREHYHSNDR